MKYIVRQNKKERQKGSIFKWVLILGAVILVLSYFGFDLQGFMESDAVSNNFAYLKEFLLDFWNNYLAEYFTIFWNYIKPLAGPVVDKIGATDDILELLKELSIPEAASIVPEITPVGAVIIEA